MQAKTTQILLSQGLVKQREIKKALHEKNNDLAKLNDEVMSQRIAARNEITKALAAFDAETRRLQVEADKDGLHKDVETLNKELQDCNKILGELLQTLEEAEPFSYTNSEAGVIMTKTIEKRSGGYTLKSVTAALVKGGIFKTEKEAEQIIKANNIVDKPVLKISDSVTGQSLDLEKELPKPTKRTRNE